MLALTLGTLLLVNIGLFAVISDMKENTHLSRIPIPSASSPICRPK